MTLHLRAVIERHATLCGCAGGFAALSGIGSPGSLVAGAAWAVANLLLWALLVRSLVSASKGGVVARRARWLAIGVVTAKLLLFLAVGVVLFAQVRVEPLSFAAGVATCTVALVVEATRATRGAVWREA